MDMVIDNGNHLLLSGNHTALDFIDRIGSRATLLDPGEAVFDFADLTGGARWRLRPNRGRMPWWLFDARRRVPDTGLADYLAPLQLFVAGRDKTIGETMTCAGTLYERLWHPVLLAGLNTDPREASAALAAAVLRATLGAGGDACRPLIARHGLSETFVVPAIEALRKRGAAVQFGARLREIVFEAGVAARLQFDGEVVHLERGDMLVLAVPPWVAKDLMPDLVVPDEHRAIVNAHFRIRPPAGQPAILGVVNGLVEWLFAFPDHMSVTISGADRLLESGRQELAGEIWGEVARLTGLGGDLPPWQIVKERRATFAATPTQDAKRPGTRTRWSNVVLAGDWTQTGLPATLEGAISSGYTAASMVGLAGNAARPQGEGPLP